MIITISGMPGSGKSTVAKILARKLRMKRYYMGGIRREMARKMGLTIDELNKLGEKDPASDEKVDSYVKKLAKKDNIIVESRTAFHFIPQSAKIFLDVDLPEAARRIAKDLKKSSRRNETRYKNAAQALRGLRRRIASDRKRFKKYYGIDCYDREKYDLLIDTTNVQAMRVAESISKYVKSVGKKV